MNKNIAKVVVGLPVDGPFDYCVKEELRDQIATGHRVHILFNRRLRVGFVVGFKERSTFKRLNTIIDILDQSPAIDSNALELAEELSTFYGCSWGEAIETSLPSALRKKNKIEVSFIELQPGSGNKKNLTTLIHDTDGRKRWSYIIKQVKDVLDHKGGVIILVPEGVYVEAVTRKLKEVFDVPMAFEKRLTPKKELEQWIQVKQGAVPIVVGTRSTAFAPVQNLQLIIVFDEENIAYKQEQSPHYHARKVVSMRSQIEQCQLMFVSSTPSAEVWKQAKSKKWKYLSLQADQLSTVQMVDMNNYNPRRSSLLSFPLQNALQKCFEHGGQAVLLMDRRGFSTLTRCNQCGFTLQCEHCSTNLAYLYSKKSLVCRHCSYKRELPKVCPNCQGSYLRSMGTGIEKLESEAARFYPAARIHCLDKETNFLPKRADLIIATQAILKWQHSLRPELVAMIDYDGTLNHFDFRSEEKAFSLLVHLRNLAKEKFLIQTRMPDDYGLKALRKMDFNGFYRQELKFRKELSLPPYQHLIAIGLRGDKEEAVFELSNELFGQLETQRPKGAEISDPHPSSLPKLRDQYRYTILLKVKQVKPILTFIKKVIKSLKRRKKVFISIDVDPCW